MKIALLDPAIGPVRLLTACARPLPRPWKRMNTIRRRFAAALSLIASSAWCQLNSAQIMTIPASPIGTSEFVTVLVPVMGCYLGTTDSQEVNRPAMEGLPAVAVTQASLSSTGSIDISVSARDVICSEQYYAVPVALGHGLSQGGYKINLHTTRGGAVQTMSTDMIVFGDAGAAVAPLPGLWAITSEVNGLPGRGFQVQLHGNTLVLTFYGYEATGKGRFWLASGTYTYNTFHEILIAYDGGTPFGGPNRPAQDAGSPGFVELTFTSPTTGTITLPGETSKPVSYFDF